MVVVIEALGGRRLRALLLETMVVRLGDATSLGAQSGKVPGE